MSPQMAENQPLFCALKALLEDLRSELREDVRARRRLQQQYAGDKAAWDVEWAALTCRLEQVPLRGLPLSREGPRSQGPACGRQGQGPRRDQKPPLPVGPRFPSCSLSQGCGPRPPPHPPSSISEVAFIFSFCLG